MNKRYLLSTLAVIFSLGAFSQIQIEKDSFSADEQDPSKFEIALYFKVTNNSSSGDTSFYWTRSVDNPCSFRSAVCDLNLCYPDTQNQADFTMSVGSEETFSVYFYPDDISGGSCGLWLYIKSKENDSNVDSAYFEASTFASLFKVQNEPLTIFPNPSDGSIAIKTNLLNSYQVEIFDITGQSVLKIEQSWDNSPIDISDLKPGQYFIKASGDQVFSGRFIRI